MLFSKKEKKEETFFCSELVATAFQKVGLLDDSKPGSSYWPGQFSNENRGKEIELLKGAKLGIEHTLIF